MFLSTGPSSKCLFLAFAVLEGCESTFGGKGNEIWFDSSIIVKLVRDEERVSSRGIAPRKKKEQQLIRWLVHSLSWPTYVN